jgi:F1F0 ATPase subunit 2
MTVTGNEPMVLAVAAVWGMVLGALYFGGLWLSLRLVPGRRRPRGPVGALYAARLAVALAGFWAALTAGPLALGAAMVGFIAMRALMVRRLGGVSGGRHGYKS